MIAPNTSAPIPAALCSAVADTLPRLAYVAGACYWPQAHLRQNQVERMGGKRRAQPSGNEQGNAASGDGDAAEGGPSRKRQTQGRSLQGAAGAAEAGSCEQEEPGWTLVPVTMNFSMRCAPSALDGRKAALEAAVEAALSKVVTEFQGQEFSVAWTRVGPSNDTLQQVLSFVLQHVKPEGAALCFQATPVPRT